MARSQVVHAGLLAADLDTIILLLSKSDKLPIVGSVGNKTRTRAESQKVATLLSLCLYDNPSTLGRW